MKNKGFTLIELLIVLVIMGAIGLMIFGGVRACSDGGEDAMQWLAPEFENAKSQRKIADELQRQNDLMERQMNMQKTPESE
jgi:prepilin-type N-terminal cleavage/methylation domain-containing protein